jgi:hypothetical protein
MSSFLFEKVPDRVELNKNLLDQVLIRFDFPILLGLAETDASGRLVTAKKSALLQLMQITNQ